MALELLATSPTQSGCFGLTFTDITGIYNAKTNPGGYGTPNPESNDINGATISIYAPGSTIPYIITFVVTTGNIDSAIITNPDGTTNDVTVDVVNTQGLSFPFSTDFSSNSLLIDETWIGGTENESLLDGVYTIVYEITLEDESTYNTTVYTLSKCNATCCITKAYANLDSACGCDADSLRSVQRADSFLNAAISAADLGMMTAAQTDIEKALEVCQGNCKTC
jgi:hypothetical protein